MRRTAAAFAPLAVWAAVVLFVGGRDIGVAASLPSGSDKVAHFLMYGVGGALAAFAWRVRGGRAGAVALGLVLLAGAVDEIHQSTLVARDADPWDWAADAAGAALAYFAVRRRMEHEHGRLETQAKKGGDRSG